MTAGWYCSLLWWCLKICINKIRQARNFSKNTETWRLNTKVQSSARNFNLSNKKLSYRSSIHLQVSFDLLLQFQPNFFHLIIFKIIDDKEFLRLVLPLVLWAVCSLWWTLAPLIGLYHGKTRSKFGFYKSLSSSTILCFPRSPFLNLGLWTSCFNLFRHPKVQFDHIYHGCYSVLGDDFRMIVYWMVPGGSSLSISWVCLTVLGVRCSRLF